MMNNSKKKYIHTREKTHFEEIFAVLNQMERDYEDDAEIDPNIYNT